MSLRVYEFKSLFFLIYALQLMPYALTAQQIRSFNPEPNQFFQELRTFIEGSYEAGEDIMNEFNAVWILDGLNEKEIEKVYKVANNSLKRRMKAAGDSIPFVYSSETKKLTHNQIKFINETANAMLKRRLKPYPHFIDYISTLMSFTTSDQTEKSFESWQNSLFQLVNTATGNKVSAYLQFSKNLFAEKVLYKTKSVVWTTTQTEFSYGFDELPKITFDLTDLKCFAKGDSMVIHQTRGVFYPTEEKWYGKGGKVNWLKAGVKEDIINAELSNYVIETQRSVYTADSVIFYNKKFFEHSLSGKLTDKCKPDVSEENASYPRFDSYDKKLEIKELFKNINFEGGFAMNGAKLLGTGDKDQDARLTFKLFLENDTLKREQENFLIASSKLFIIEDDKALSSNASVRILLEKDSIYHPRLQFKLFIKKINNITIGRELTLIRSNEGLAKMPFYNTYHKTDMYFEELYWKIDDPQIKFQQSKGLDKNSEALFESSDYYRDARYFNIQTLDAPNPLVLVREFDKYNGKPGHFYAREFAAFTKMSEVDGRQMIMKLANMGFIDYDFETDFAVIKTKLLHYLAANAKQRDYDVINFNSVTIGQANATLNLLNYDMNMNGVSKIFLSDSQSVFIVPTDKKITLQKNRDFLFAGMVRAGQLDFFGKEFSFQYDNFKINMPIVDSLQFWIAEQEEKTGDKKYVRGKSVIEYMRGELMIDHPGNKSGSKSFSKYPVFNSDKDSYVFYDRGFVQNGVYKRDNFYFHLNPFTFDSLDNFNPASIALEGSFASDSIFPDFEETLRFQPDKSLGFVRPTPPDGFTAYGGKGRYFNNINLSNQGLRGDGKLNYLTSTTNSKDFIFFPDSMNTLCETFEIQPQNDPVQYPDMKGEKSYIHWMPFHDVMHIYSKEHPLAFYSGKAEMYGHIALTPEGLSGDGQVDFYGASLKSDIIKFGQKALDSDTAKFAMASMEAGETNLDAFKADNVNAHVDFETKKGEFKSNGEGAFLDFPANQYICYMDKFTWNMEKGDIELGATKKEIIGDGDRKIELEGAKFISTHPKQDSLYFFAATGKFDVRNKIINAEDVKLVYVADATIFPDSNKLTVRKNAKMDPLLNSKILANNTTKYHNIYNSEININGRKSYDGKGDYDYIDELRRKQKIRFEKIDVDTTGQTIAFGKIADTVEFKLNDKFEFAGDVKLTANNEFLNFGGFSRISHNCSSISRSWFDFTADINPKEIYIPVSVNPTSLTKDILASGLLMTTADSTSIYSAFLSLKGNKTDKELTPTDGFLYYDKGSKEYRISNKEKLNEMALPGNYISMNTINCEVYNEGKLNLGTDFGQLKLSAVGNGYQKLKDGTTEFDVMLVFNFFLADNVLKIMSDNILNDNSLKGVDYARPVYERGLAELTDRKTADKLISEINLYGEYKKLPDELEKTLVFTHMNMKWDYGSTAYISNGKIGIGNIEKRQINKYVNGSVQILKKNSGDMLSIYMEASKDNWYFFTYFRGLMQVISSSDDFNNIIKDLKPDKRKSKTAKGDMSYQFVLSTGAKKNKFLTDIGWISE